MRILHVVLFVVTLAACGAVAPPGTEPTTGDSKGQSHATEQAATDEPGATPDEASTNQPPCGNGLDGSAACPEASVVADGGADGCVTLVATPADVSCTADADCTAIVVGPVCPGFVPTLGDRLGTLCANGAANSAGAARLTAELLAIPHGDDAGLDFCDAVSGGPHCVSGECVLSPP